MKLRTFMLGGALALAAVSGLAQADDHSTDAVEARLRAILDARADVLP